MSKHSPGFVVCHEAYYAKACMIVQPEITIGVYHEGSGDTTSGEMRVRWHQFEDGHSAPRLDCYYDAFNSLLRPEFLQVLKDIRKDRAFTPEEFVAVLLKNGFRDITQRRPR